MGFINFDVTRRELKNPSFGKIHYCLRICTWTEHSPFGGGTSLLKALRNRQIDMDFHFVVHADVDADVDTAE